ncbi:hypothetical protein PWG71_25005 [Nocardiopsis sp. N85]|uniref:hypothetical protein n=1 Tax=Nocardiopsis sp. N85 TaxID=3029400 RepID=UPI00237F1FD9|nr:hypothetical protein [Nocardiopsis sp. N85]MDE3724661.1 hypothetical protein [Nocardiopsis sp. N85]
MEFTKISGGCEDDPCPAVYTTDRKSYIVQGYTISDPDVLRRLGLPPGENAVEIPHDLLEGLRGEAR